MKTGLYFDPYYPMHDLFYDGTDWWWLDLEFVWIKHAVDPSPASLVECVLVMEVKP